MAVVEKQDVVVGLAGLAHDGSTDLTKADTMTPTLAVEHECLLLTPDS